GMCARAPPPQRPASLPAPSQHAAVELFRGTMVRHKVIAYRDDRVGAGQPIAWSGDGWREYVPIRVPWTGCTRERVPRGSVAVMINRAHPFPDLVLPVDSTGDRLLGAIDGKRALAEILQLAGQSGAGERQALGFFERLWQYDQVVFDASRATTEAEREGHNAWSCALCSHRS